MPSRPTDDDSLFDTSPAADWESRAVERSLDELFLFARHYRSSQAYTELLRFVTRFRTYSPFNAMLAHLQLPGAIYVAPAHRWARDYGRRVRLNARPIVLLQPMGPVMFVFDVSDTEPVEEWASVPREVDRPFEPAGAHVANELANTIESAKRDGVSVTEGDAGSQSAGAICPVQSAKYLKVLARLKPETECVDVPLRYELVLNRKHSREAKYATFAHELGHLYCGHLGTPNSKWWPDRRGLTEREREFEAESVCYLVCQRLGLDNPSAEYLSQYVSHNESIPDISVDCVMKAAGLVEQMGAAQLRARKDRDQR